MADETDYEKHMKPRPGGGADPTFDPAGLPPLKPCPLCKGRLEYWAKDFVACTETFCGFERVITE